jgi:glyoxylase-like metal-dependent hydrolase (beta-lactamase superfamily II)/8-oxo-dGTP pyrophosphatase MutT (NUDIX family)
LIPASPGGAEEWPVENVLPKRTRSTGKRRRAAAVVPRLPDGRVLVGTRTDKARSWAGTVAFPGGACEPEDDALPLATRHAPEGSDAMERACALRELAEEAGLLVACTEDGVADEAAARRCLEAHRAGAPLLDALRAERLMLDGRGLVPLTLWQTFEGRFGVRQLLLPLSAEPPLAPPLVDELADLVWRDPKELLRSWEEGRVLLIPAVRRVVAGLAAHADDFAAMVRALSVPPTWSERARQDVVAGAAVIAARTPTLPPATHTNAVLLGEDDALLVDPATPWEDERARFDDLLQASLGHRRVAAIVCTHHHHDHVGDVERLARRHGWPVWAHAETAHRVAFPIDRVLADDALLLDRYRVIATPGHAPGHVCLFDERTRLLVAGDMVAGVGSILIDPPEGHMGTYLASLDRLIALAPRALIPAHGPVLADGTRRLIEQREHRRARHDSVLEALRGSATGLEVGELVRAVYGGATPSGMLALAARSVLAILGHARELGEVEARGERYFARAPGPA